MQEEYPLVTIKYFTDQQSKNNNYLPLF